MANLGMGSTENRQAGGLAAITKEVCTLGGGLRLQVATRMENEEKCILNYCFSGVPIMV